MTTENDDDDAESFGAFMKYLNRALGTEDAKKWLSEHFPSSPKTEETQKSSSDPISQFFQTALGKAEKANEKLQSQMEAMRDLLTPEQLTLLRSRQSGGEPSPGENGPKPGDPPQKPEEKPEAKPARRKWL